MINHDIVRNVALNIAQKYDVLLNTFNDITLCAQQCFEQKEYLHLFTQQQERYRLYGKFVKEVVADTQAFLGADFANITYWIEIKAAFSEVIKDKPHKLNSETFYNSITRKVFVNVSFNSEYEFFDYTDYKPVKTAEEEVFCCDLYIFFIYNI